MKTPTRTLVTNRLCPAIATVALLLFGTNALLAQQQDFWSGSGTGNWNDPNDWTDAAAPTAYDSLVFQGGNTANNNNYANGTAFDGISFSSGASPFTLSGSSILLSGNLSGISNGIVNGSGSLQTVSLNLNLDWGFHTFVGGTATMALNGTMTLNGGSVAYFDPNVTSTSLVNDASGLITGLGGAGLTYSGTGTTSAFTGLATMTGTSVGSYSSWGSIVPSTGAIGATTPGAAVNVELTATAAGNYTLANGAGITYLNTVFLANASTATLVVGSAGGAQTIDVGAVSGIGGFYVPAGVNTQALTVGSGAQTILTAGPETGAPTPGTIVYAVNGTNSSNQAENNATIIDNLSGGPVTVVKTGTGTMYTGGTLTNTYSGGTYILQGQYQGGQVASFGTGPVYVASNASVYFNNGGFTNANNFFLSPGTGAPDGTSVEGLGTGGALIIGSSSAYVFTGTMNLLGAAATAAPGCRIGSASTPTMKITGQITGTGTLEFFTAHSGSLTLANPNTTGSSANNFQGGVILDGPQGGHAVNADLIMGTNNQIPSGPNAGNVTLMPAETTVYSRFDLNGTSQTINGLIGVYGQGNASSNQLANFAGSTAATLTVGANNNQNNQFIGYAVDSAASPISIIKVGTNTQTFYSQAYSFGYHGATTVSNGTLALSSSASPVSFGIPNCPTINVVNPGVLDASGLSIGGLNLAASQTLAGTGTVNSSGGTVINGTIKPFYGQIGTLTISNTVNLTGGSTYVWDVNNATTGTAGGDPGWALLNVPTGLLQLSAGTTPGQQITIKVTSLTNGDVPGLAVFNPNINQHWMIATAGNPIYGFNTAASQFVVDTSSFSNGVGLATQFSVTNMIPTDLTGNNLYLVFNSVALITTNLVSQTNISGSTVSFTVGASGTGINYAWTENGNPLVNGGASSGNAAVSITTNGPGTDSTLTLTGVQGGDNSLIAVSVTANGGGSGNSEADLVVITPPLTVSLTPSPQPSTPAYQGSAVLLTAGEYGAENGTLTYQWYLNGQPIAGATNMTYVANISATNYNGTYTVTVADQAGGLTTTSYSTTANAPLSVVPNQIIFEPFNYPDFIPARLGSAGTWTALNVTNNYNQVTGAPVGWLETGTKVDFRTRAPSELADPASTVPAFSGPPRSLTIPDEYPMPGLASGYTWQGPASVIPLSPSGYGDYGWGYNPANGGDTNVYTDYGPIGSDPVCYTSSDVNGNQVNLPLGQTITSGPVYCSMVVGNGSFSTSATSVDYYCGFGNGSTSGTTQWASLYLQGNAGGSAPVPYQMGIFKGNLTPGTLSPGVNGAWDPNILSGGQVYFVVMRLNINPSGGSTCDMWIDPPASSFNNGEANVPTPDVQGVAGSAADVAGGVSFFYMKITTYPVSRDITDLRIGTTWASVTPPAAPTLSVNNSILSPCNPAPAVFTAQNAGNQVTGNYQWTFNSGSGPVALSPGSNPNPANPGDGAVITIGGPSNQVLTVTGATGAEVGAYTASGSNISPAPSDNGGPNEYSGVGTQNVVLTGSGSGTLSFFQPPLSIGYSGTQVVLKWPTNQAQCYSLEYTSKLLPTNWTVINPPYSLDGTGTNYTVTVTPATQSVFYQLIASP